MITNNKNASAAINVSSFDNDSYVADFLRESPDFFARNPELLLELEVPHRQRGAVSLVERRLTMQREQYDELQQRLSEIVDIAHQNDYLAELLHDYSLGLMSATGLNEVFELTKDTLEERLQCDLTKVVIRHNEVVNACVNVSQLDRYLHVADTELFTSLGEMNQQGAVYCGYPIAHRVEHFFPEKTDEIRSFALVQLNYEEESSDFTMGYLALASHNKSRFGPQMGTDFLSRFGSLLSARLAVFY